MPVSFRVGVTRDLLPHRDTLGADGIGLDILEAVDGVEWEFLAERVDTIRADQAAEYDALFVLGCGVTAETLAGVHNLSIVARFGVGYDRVDVEACTRNAVLLTITPDGVRRPVASSALALILALAHKLHIKDKLTREGRWADRADHMGMGLSGRVLGIIGLGNIGRELCDLARPFGMRYIAHDPYADAAQAQAAGAELVDLDALLGEADFVCITCQLTDETRHLIDASRLSRMKPTAYLINVARGPIVHQPSLVDALRKRTIQGAALDVFDPEPPDADDPILSLDNVILTPHAVCWTDECFRGVGRSACAAIVDVAAGRPPTNVVNRDVLADPRMQDQLKRYASR
ncbi:dehydrogenase [Candidatus Poribacteria bacterium]|jgi:phosphoglycerate dehydrogenase-like enzyme|nr:dehydrogenase [Candidatus Poribacteria bacterium]MBT5535434.1 dehydrogenase [Candidatus Poribacteria bacterium]MBT5712871.1 dehydrogenase [Candidatus Poribacteria bacterium]MBT7097474.1 dehydrogenase [Candidatus Poribacteria bacterium]MBT7807070.1 dehydrogenase [Candidatus Poribacteria bacterium]